MKTLILFVALLLSVQAFSQLADDDNRIQNQYIVMLQPSTQVGELLKAFPSLQINQVLSKRMNIWLLERDSIAGAGDFLNELKKSSLVKLAQFNHRIQQRNLVPDDPYFYKQWNMLNATTPGADIDATDAWAINHNNLTANGDTVVVAIVDGAFDLTHPDINFFFNYNWAEDSADYPGDSLGWNVIDNSGDITDGEDDNHAMHVSGIAGAIGNNDTGVAGVCWGAKILRVTGASQTESYVVAAYAYVINMRALYNSTQGARGAFVVSTNSSFGVGEGGAQPADYPIWCAMYDTMGFYGILSAAAAPDAAVDVDLIGDVPTGCPSKYLITVTNTTSTDQINSAAGYGKKTIDIGAPGTEIYSTITGGQYGYMTGTSMSSPHLAGTVAAMFAAACPQMIDDYYQYPDSIALIVKQMILDGAQRLPDLFNETVTGGRLNLYHAIRNLEEYNCNQCNYTASINLAQPTCSESCNAVARLNISPAGNYSNYWTTGDVNTDTLGNLCAGFYSVVITDSTGCVQVRNFSVFNPDNIIISNIHSIPVDSAAAGKIIVSATAGNDTLAYSLNGVNYQVLSPDTFIIDTNGTYTIYVMDETGGCVITRNVNVFPSGIENILNTGNWSVYPNPLSVGSWQLAVGTDLIGAQVEILDAQGRVVYKSEIKNTHSEIAPPLSGGVYLLQIISGTSIVAKKLVKL